ncbi:hypothetical protein BDW72DRAFT_167375 [Aspergillus terricola var. indicus]
MVSANDFRVISEDRLEAECTSAVLGFRRRNSSKRVIQGFTLFPCHSGTRRSGGLRRLRSLRDSVSKTERLAPTEYCLLHCSIQLERGAAGDGEGTAAEGGRKEDLQCRHSKRTGDGHLVMTRRKVIRRAQGDPNLGVAVGVMLCCACLIIELTLHSRAARERGYRGTQITLVTKQLA